MSVVKGSHYDHTDHGRVVVGSGGGGVEMKRPDGRVISQDLGAFEGDTEPADVTISWNANGIVHIT
jgi:hypothetical protein